MKYMAEHPTDTTNLLTKESQVDETSHFYISRYSIVDQHNRLWTSSLAFHDVRKTHDFQVRELSELIGLTEVNTFLLMLGEGTRQVRQRHGRKVLAKELLDNPWVMARLETERQPSLRLRLLIVTMGEVGEGIAHRLVALEVMRTCGEDTIARKVTQRRCFMCGNKALAACQAWHKPSEGAIAYLCGQNLGHDCVALHMAWVPSKRRRRLLGGDVHTPALAHVIRCRRRSSTE